MSYAKDKTIIDFLCQIDKLFQDNAQPLNQTYSFVLGYKLHTYLSKPQEIPPIFNAFASVSQFEDLQVVREFERNKLFINVISNPQCDVEKKLNQILSDEVEESKEVEPKVSKDQLEKAAQLYETFESILFEHIAFTEEESRLQPLDCTMWGFFCSQYASKHSVKEIFEKLLSVRQAQISGIVNHNQKVKIFLKLFNNWNLDLNSSFNKLLENPSLGSQPISSLVIPEEEMTRILVQQMALEEEFDLEKARLAKEKDDYEDVLCNICLVELYDKDEDAYLLDACGHNFHVSCLTDCLLNSINNRTVPIKCPQDNCKTEFMESDLRELLKPEDLEKYYQYIIDDYIGKNKKQIVYCLTAGCSYAFIKGEETEQFDCPHCLNSYCLKCCQEAHPGDCDSAVLVKVLDTLKHFNYKACPFCKVWVEKTVGCDHMRCTCGGEFCYRCGRPYNEEIAKPCSYMRGDPEVDYYENIYHSIVGQDRQNGQGYNNSEYVLKNKLNRRHKKRRK